MQESGKVIWGTVGNFVEDGPVLGRRVANTTFLQALLTADPYDEYHFFLPDENSLARLREWLRRGFPGLMEKDRIHVGDLFSLQAHLGATSYHCMHLPDIILYFTQLARMRNRLAPHIFPITGATHSLSYARFMPEYARHLWRGVCGRDAIMVTSESARLVLERIFAGLAAGYGLEGQAAATPLLERIPLGVRTEDLPEPRERWDCQDADREPPSCGKVMRDILGIGGETAFLCLSRFCPASKMDVMPLFAALRRARSLGLTTEKYVLILAGWAEEDDPLPQALRQFGASLGIRVLLFLRPTAQERKALFAASDVFVSPSDNVQETFGLTIAEASAAALPVIASDFDGYRDIAVHEETGLLVPTLGFAASEETDMQAMLWFDNQYHFKLAQQTVVRVPEFAAALVRLGLDQDLRRKMGLAGRARARSLFSWDMVIKQYVSFWEKLARIPLSSEEEEHLRLCPHPLQMRFADYFRGHFSEVLDETVLGRMTLQRTAVGEAAYRGILPLSHHAGMEHLLDENAVRRMLLAARKPVGAARLRDIVRDFFAEGGLPLSLAKERAEFSLLWALKHDYMEESQGFDT